MLKEIIKKHTKYDSQGKKYIGIKLSGNLVDNENVVRADHYIVAWAGYVVALKAKRDGNLENNKSTFTLG